MPLIKSDNAKITAWDKSIEESVGIHWDWTNAIFTPKLTYFEVEEGNKAGAVIVQFMPIQRHPPPLRESATGNASDK